jgi:hypothetical protein
MVVCVITNDVEIPVMGMAVGATNEMVGMTNGVGAEVAKLAVGIAVGIP